MTASDVAHRRGSRRPCRSSPRRERRTTAEQATARRSWRAVDAVRAGATWERQGRRAGRRRHRERPAASGAAGTVPGAGRRIAPASGPRPPGVAFRTSHRRPRPASSMAPGTSGSVLARRVDGPAERAAGDVAGDELAAGRAGCLKVGMVAPRSASLLVAGSVRGGHPRCLRLRDASAAWASSVVRPGQTAASSRRPLPGDEVVERGPQLSSSRWTRRPTTRRAPPRATEGAQGQAVADPSGVASWSSGRRSAREGSGVDEGRDRGDRRQGRRGVDAAAVRRPRRRPKQWWASASSLTS